MKEGEKQKKYKFPVGLWIIPIVLGILGMLIIALSPAIPNLRIIAASMTAISCVIFGSVYYIYRKGQ